MKSQSLHPADQDGVMQMFRPVGEVLHNAVEAATNETRGFFQSQPEGWRHYDVWTGAQLTRYFACRFLQQLGHDARIDRLWLPNNGIALRSEDLDIRCVKSRDGLPPSVGRSMARRHFCNQSIIDSLFMFDAVADRTASVNLLVTWTTDATGSLVRMDIHSPSYADRDVVRTYWSDHLLSPVETFEFEPEEMDVEPEDLPGYEDDRPDTGAAINAR